jgi:hypothetical protein
MANEDSTKQLLHLVIGGELSSLEGVTFADLDKVDIHTRYFIVHLHRLLEPETHKP